MTASIRRYGMGAATVEERLDELEAKIERLESGIGESNGNSGIPGWKRIIGTFANCPEYDEAMRLGREYRETLPPDPIENVN